MECSQRAAAIVNEKDKSKRCVVWQRCGALWHFGAALIRAKKETIPCHCHVIREGKSVFRGRRDDNHLHLRSKDWEDVPISIG